VNRDAPKRVFRPRPLPAVLALAFCVGLASLGQWQWHRAQEKEAQALSFAAQEGEIANFDADTEYPLFARIRVSGEYRPEQQFLVDNIVQDGLAGYYVITPMALGDGDRLLLVNRGWVEHRADRELPDVDIKQRAVTITGRIGWLPRPGMRLDGPAVGLGSWPRVAVFPTTADLGAALRRDVFPFVVLLDSPADDGLSRQWSPGGMTAERHIGYAVQWWALALAFAVVFVMANRKTEMQ
jgi:surfeit locus 1 family protein